MVGSVTGAAFIDYIERSVVPELRALDALVDASAHAVESLTTSELANRFRHAGYAN